MSVFYHNPRCSKSRQALALLQENGHQPQVVEYLKTPPTAAELSEILKKLGRPAQDIVRLKEAREAGFEPAGLSDAALLAKLAAHPAAIERPIFVHGKRAALGRPPEQVLHIL
ncbi:arsenate reductase (glutaredoxin) [Ferrovibrio sp.]|uniref:arsenate reductase (glutaredoxin) n=1 Tax=Ferrovibrio sp. TaxID=1917215 RepID=UPI0025BA49FE|nr:arsenate reductase (glutaredoxin) [Ferrovibrio sp.]MBX3453575.1 arsenate reductase (glutaredoxin) [Ferrovibrio sp.]